MHLALCVLQILGIVLLALLGIVLVLALLVLFVPIRYKIFFQKELEKDAQIKIYFSWLFPIVWAKMLFEDELQFFLRVFGILIIGRKKKKLAYKKKQKQKQLRARKGKSQTSKKNSPCKEVTKKEPEPLPANFDEDLPKEEEEIREKKTGKTEEKITEKNTSQAEESEIVEKIETAENNKLLEEMESIQASQKAEKIETAENSKQAEEAEDIVEPDGMNTEEAEAIVEPDGMNVEEESKQKKEKEIFRFLHILWSWRKKIKIWYKNRGKLLKKIRKMPKRLLEEAQPLRMFLKKEENKKGFGMTYRVVMTLLKHGGPKKWKGYIRFGMQNPADTGKVLGIIGAVTGLLGWMPQVEADFTKEIFVADLVASGRIRLVVILKYGIQWFIDDNVVTFREEIEQLRRK